VSGLGGRVIADLLEIMLDGVTDGWDNGEKSCLLEGLGMGYPFLKFVNINKYYPIIHDRK